MGVEDWMEEVKDKEWCVADKTCRDMSRRREVTKYIIF